MNKSLFNPANQHSDTSGKIVAGLERISEAFKVLLWEQAKVLAISPIQIQILIFIAYHKVELCNVSHLAREFNVTKPTISDAVQALTKKNLIVKDHSSADSRSYSILLSPEGKKAVSETENFADPLKLQLNNINQDELENMFATLSKLIFQLHRTGILSVQRTCYGCKFYDNSGLKDHCNLLDKELKTQDIRLDCPEFEQKAVH